MHIAVLGAHGPTGQLLTRQALDAGHRVTAVTRRPDFPLRSDALTVARADATDPREVADAIRGADAVASVLGTRYSREPITLYSASARALVAAMVDQGIDRLVVTSSLAAAPWADPTWGLVERVVVHRILDRLGRTLYADMRRMEQIVADSPLSWTAMRPLGLADMEPPTEYAVAVDHISGRQTARRDLAAAILDELEHDRHPRQCVAVATTNKSVSLPATIWREGIRPTLASRGGSRDRARPPQPTEPTRTQEH